MSTLLIRDENLSTAIKEHIDEFDLRPIILISKINGMSPLDVDVFTIGICPSKELINIVAEVLKKLIEERDNYLAGKDTE